MYTHSGNHTPNSHAGDPEANATKLARIRDNQRRSRAKRQEHVRDLEQRIAACHSACRETDLLRQAVEELRKENAVLRNLLAEFGVEGATIDTAVADERTGGRNIPAKSDAGSRQDVSKQLLLKPKLTVEGNGVTSHIGDRVEYGLGRSKQSAALLKSIDVAPTTAMATDSRSHAEDLDWLFENDPEAQAKANAFCHEALREGSTSIADSDNRESVLCSVAKDMIEQYDVPPEDLIATKRRLTRGFCLPSGLGGGCRIRNETLFEVLKDLSSRYA
jgi:hypothetical protein